MARAIHFITSMIAPFLQSSCERRLASALLLLGLFCLGCRPESDAPTNPQPGPEVGSLGGSPASGPLGAGPPGAQSALASPRYNVLFVSIDDLRPELGVYDAPGAVTPHIDRLGERSLVFRRAFCSLASCAPSRAAVFTGLRPGSNGVRDLSTNYRDSVSDVVALPELFRNAGAFTAAFGKVHHGPPEGPAAKRLDDPLSWSVPCWRPERWQTYYATAAGRKIRDDRIAEAQRAAEARGEKLWGEPKGPAFEAPDVSDTELGDGRIAQRAIEVMAERKGERFFLAVGFLKPHMPFIAPKRYWDLHPLESLPPAAASSPPQGAPLSLALTDSAEVRAHAGMPLQGPIPAEVERKLVQGYLACVSYVDAQVGRLLEALDDLNLAENTIVVLWGDHGWHLGEHGMWGKHTNYEVATRVPLIVHVPGGAAAKTDALVELIDLYPTLAELCGLEAPSRCEGESFTPLLKDPEAPGKPAIFTEYPRVVQGDRVIGHAVRSETHRYVEWRAEGELEPRATEFYELSPEGKGGAREASNLIGEARVQKELEAHRELLEQGPLQGLQDR